MSIKICGASDDLIEMYGDIDEEFNHNSDDPINIGFSDGTLLKMWYDDDGIWRINRIVAGAATYNHIPGSVEDDTSDVLELSGDMRWVLLGTQKLIKKAGS